MHEPCTPDQQPAIRRQYQRLIQMPAVPGSWPSPAPSFGKLGAELFAPVPDALMADHHAAFGQDQLDIPQAEALPSMSRSAADPRLVRNRA
jgi:hypothetical protein